jgi:hypothetical protein
MATPLKPMSPSRLKPVLETISEFDLVQDEAWNDLADLSKYATFTGIEAHPSGVYETGGNNFEAVATVYVTLSFDASNAKSFSKSIPAHVFGTFDGNNVTIDKIRIDKESLKS